MAGIIGLLAIFVLRLLVGLSWPGSFFAAIVLAVIVGLVFSWIMCRPLPAVDEVTAAPSAGTGAGAGAGNGGSASDSAGAGSSGASTAGAAAAGAAAGGAAGAVSSSGATSDSAKASGASAAEAAATPASFASVPSDAGAADDASSAGSASGASGAAKDAASAKPAAAKSADKKPAAKKPAAKKPAAAKSAKAAAKPAAEASTSGGQEGEPAMLSGPRDGGADDLKLLKGVGPKLENTLNDMGVYHFDQVAAWGAKDIAWVDDRLKFKGRIERDGWVEQAKILAAGGTTEFSERSKKG